MREPADVSCSDESGARSGVAGIGTYTDRPAAPGVEIRAIPSEQELVVYFYELHEGDEDVFSDLILARETEMEPDVFFDIVQTIRRRVQDTFETDYAHRGDRRGA